LNKSLARSNKNPFYQGFLTGIVTINLREFIYVICRSPRKSIVFKCLSRYLRDTFVASHSVIFSSPNRAGRALDENDNAITINKSCNDTHLMHEEVMFASAKFPNVELIDLVTDVAGLVREGSQCTQYMHHCYTVSPNTKPVVLQVYPPTPETSV